MTNESFERRRERLAFKAWAFLCEFDILHPNATLNEAIREAYARVPLFQGELNAHEPGACGWQPIETAPIDGTPILAWVKGCNKHHDYGDTLVVRADQTMNQIYMDRGGERFWGFPGVGGLRASHWMPIPEPPVQRT